MIKVLQEMSRHAQEDEQPVHFSVSSRGTAELSSTQLCRGQHSYQVPTLTKPSTHETESTIPGTRVPTDCGKDRQLSKNQRGKEQPWEQPSLSAETERSWTARGTRVLSWKCPRGLPGNG